MAHTGINLENVKENNRSAILRLLNEQGAMSRKDLSERLGLTAATVTLICSDLIASGILCEQGEVKEGKRAGRRKILVGIDYSCRCVLSIRIEIMETCITISDLKGSMREEKWLKTDTGISAEAFFAQVAKSARQLLAHTGTPMTKILGIGVSVPGVVDRELGVSKSAYRIWDQRVDVAGLLREHFSCPIIVENNIKAFAEAELVYGSGRKHENLLFLKWGPGIGSAMVIHNEIYEGRTSKEGELGHVTVEKGGKLCRCGRRGCLETKAAIHSVAQQVRENCTPETMPVLYEWVRGDLEQINARDIANWIQAEDAGMWMVLDEIIELVARNACHAITLLAPDTVILYGEIFDLPQMRDRFQACCREYDPAYDENYIFQSELSERMAYIGPLALVVNKLFLASGGALDETKK